MVADAAGAADAAAGTANTVRGSLRWILIHVTQETARHLGQLDLLREMADGGVGEEPE